MKISISVARLHFDILGEVFMAIISDFPSTESTDRKPIRTLRVCSQVCRDWRSFILHSAFLWGGALHLDVLNLGDEENIWRQEVMRRTGNARLWVQGTSTHQTSTHHFLFSFLRKYWTRIERLDLKLSRFREASSEEKTLDVFFLPAPNLTNFTVEFRDLEDTISAPSIKMLFGDVAPRLQVLRAPRLPFTSHASWLTRLQIAEFHNTFSITEVLDALERMHVIEEILIPACSIPSPFHRSHITAHRLRRLEIHGCLSGTLVILANLTPAPRCCLTVFLHPPFPICAVFAKLAVHQLTRYFGICFRQDPVPEVYLECLQGDIIYELGTGGSTISLYITGCTELPQGYFSLLEKCLHFSKVDTLRLEMEDFHPDLVQALQSLAASSFPSLTCLKTNPEGLNVAFQTSLSIPFPALRSVELDGFYQVEDLTDVKKNILEFTITRKESGYPLYLLDFIFTDEEESFELNFLEHVLGLRVCWHIK